MKLATLEIPVIVKIDHKTGTFVYDLGPKKGEIAPEYTTQERVIIGLVKQRRFWQQLGGENENPSFKLGCASNEGLIGKPTKHFPWGQGTFSLQTGATEIKCAECPFNKPIGHYAQDRSSACGHQWLLITSDTSGGDVSVLKLNGAAVKVAASHLREYQVAKVPAFADSVHFNLHNAKRNGNRYAELEINFESRTSKKLWASVFLPLYKKWSAILETPPSPRTSGSNGREGLRPLSM